MVRPLLWNSIFIIERLGRRKVLIAGFTAEAVFLIPVTVILSVNSYSGLGWLVPFEIFVFLFLGAAGFNFGIIGLYVVEINAQRFRAGGAALSLIIYYAVSFGMAFAYRRLGVHPGWPAVFVVVNLLGAGTTYLLYPETTGRSLEWLDQGFERSQLSIGSRNKMSTKVNWTVEDEDVALQSLN